MYLKLSNYAQKLQALGIGRAVKTIGYAVQHQCNRLRFGQVPTQTNWHELQQKGFKTPQQPLSFIMAYKSEQEISTLIARADRYVEGYFAPLGAQEQHFKEMPWFCDVRLLQLHPSADAYFDATTFFKDIKLPSTVGNGVGKDIKVPWELARFQHLALLGYAYKYTGTRSYAAVAQTHIASWLDANEYCYGIHWFNGLEVALRAINWIIAVLLFGERWQKDAVFYKRVVCSLYDHMRYLEHNWEWYDGRTNNHYVANLVGYTYLSWFFRSISRSTQKWQWCGAQLQQELEWQIFAEGSSYEGSTRYHAFVLELFLHGFLVSRVMQVPNASLNARVIDASLERMMEFYRWTKPTATVAPVCIGDDDGGSVMDANFLSVEHLYAQWKDSDSTGYELPGKKYYAQFGISIVKERPWHVTLRHHQYTRRQPPGHFHDDRGSITIFYHGVPLIVDPGTYVYSASAAWRTYFRAASVHNGIYCTTSVRAEELFSLPAAFTPRSVVESCMETALIFKEGMVKRYVAVTDVGVSITDVCEFVHPTLLHWNYTLAPRVVVTLLPLGYQAEVLGEYVLNFSSSVPFSVAAAMQSPRYGVMQNTICLQAAKIVTKEIVISEWKVHTTSK
jgi:hypothetical protein